MTNLPSRRRACTYRPWCVGRMRDHGWVELEERTGRLAEWVADRGVVVLSGAGLSTESGIPDYRGPSGAARRHAPMTYQAFTRDPMARWRGCRSWAWWTASSPRTWTACTRPVARTVWWSCTAAWPGSRAWIVARPPRAGN